MANALGKSERSSGGKVNTVANKYDGIPKSASMNQLPSNARVVKPATSNLMAGTSHSRGHEGIK